VHFIKDNLFTAPPIFAEIARVSRTPEKEMHQVYNMGHRLEIYTNPDKASEVVELANTLGLEAKIIGKTEASTLPQQANHVTIIKDKETLVYT
jgi:phosphoribosylformylglycinamidine cyclo-ligase